MKTKLLILAALSVQGCVWQTTSMSDIEKAVDYCKDKGGLYQIDVIWSGKEYATCVDRKYKESTNLSMYMIEGE